MIVFNFARGLAGALRGDISKAPGRPAGMPAPASVVKEKPLTPAGPAALAPGRLARTYLILRTTEVDPKDPVMPRTTVPDFGMTAAPVDDNFAGTARKVAKLSISEAATQTFGDLRDLIETLPSKRTMKGHRPPITTETNSKRVAAEDRNVRVKAFLYAASREDDRDFHLIIGRSRRKRQPMYITVEISGLPPRSRKSFEPDHRSVVITATSRATGYGATDVKSRPQSRRSPEEQRHSTDRPSELARCRFCPCPPQECGRGRWA